MRPLVFGNLRFLPRSLYEPLTSIYASAQKLSQMAPRFWESTLPFTSVRTLNYLCTETQWPLVFGNPRFLPCILLISASLSV